MKHVRQLSHTLHPFFVTLILTSLLSLGAGLTFLESAAAESLSNPQGITPSKQVRNNRLPNSVVNAIRQDIARNNRIPPGQLRVVSSRQQTWPNSCLGLAKPDEACAQILIENGWRVVMSDSRRTWVYRTDNTGRIVRLESQEAPRPGTPTSGNLPETAANRVLQAAAQHSGLRLAQLRIVKTEPMTTDGCLGLPRPNEPCPELAMSAWEVTVQGGQQRLVYRTDAKGSEVRLNERASNIGEGDTRLPQAAANAILRTASQRIGVQPSRLRIVKFAQITTDGCLNLPSPGEACTRIAMPAWEVTVASGEQLLVYRSDVNGTQVRLNEAASNIGSSTNLPRAVADAVVQFASQQFNLPVAQMRIVRAEQQTWADGCLGLPSPVERCMAVLTPGWRVVMDGKGQSLIVRTDDTGSRVRAEAIANLPPTNDTLPGFVAQSVLRDASVRWGTTRPGVEWRIVQAQRQVWRDGCLGLAEPGVGCTLAMVPGWRVTVDNGQERWTYRTDDSGSMIRLEGENTYGERPSPLPKSVVFQAITSGGIAGRTYQTTLLSDGRLVRTLVGPNTGTASPELRQISRQQVQQFQQLLQQQKFAQFNRQEFPAPTGAADYINVTLTSQDGTVSYADIVHNQLPEPLQAIIQSWNQIAGR